MLELKMAIPGHPGRSNALGWVPRAEVGTFAFGIQLTLRAQPHRWWASLCQAGFERRSGKQATLSALAGCASDEARFAVLKAGLLFALIDSSRFRWRNHMKLPPYAEMRALQDKLLKVSGLEWFPWIHVHSDVLPSVPEGSYWYAPRVDSRREFTSIQSLEEELTHLAALVLAHWVPVRVRFAQTDEEVAKVLADFEQSPMMQVYLEQEAREQARQAQEQALARAQWVEAAPAREAEAALRAAERAELLRKHPRHGEWPVSGAEVKTLIWAQPLTAVASLFGVSDTAIRKFCDKRGIERPPQGYWLRAGRRAEVPG